MKIAFGMKKIALLALSLICLYCGFESRAQSPDAFTPIGKYIQAGDYENLSVWFATNLEVSIFGESNTCSRNQARLIMKNFFEEYTPKSFAVIHKSSQATMKYALGELAAGGEVFRILLYVDIIDGKSYVEQIVIDRR